MTCAVEQCDRGALSSGWCNAHYSRWKATGDVQAHKPIQRYACGHQDRCTVDGCDRTSKGRDLCGAHYARLRKYGGVDADRPLKDQRPLPCPHRQAQARIKLMLIATLGGECWMCGGSFPPECFDFHHRNPAEKDDLVSRLGRSSAGFDLAIREASKCDLLCANCHRITHRAA